MLINTFQNSHDEIMFIVDQLLEKALFFSRLKHILSKLSQIQNPFINQIWFLLTLKKIKKMRIWKEINTQFSFNPVNHQQNRYPNDCRT
jgi:hypothetical protein